MKNNNLNILRIKKEIVHKKFDENIFALSVEQESEKKFKVIGRLPSDHILYNDQLSGLSASPFFIELSRQASIAICHLFFNIKLDHIFTMLSMDWDYPGSQPCMPRNFDPVICYMIFKQFRTRKQFTYVKVIGNLFQKDVNILNGESTFLAGKNDIDENEKNVPLSPVIQSEQIANPELVQVKSVENVLITRPRYDKNTDTVNTQMVVDINHQYFYEHFRAHVPGMMLLEAGKQAAVGALKTKFAFLTDTYGDIKKGKIEFSNFAKRHSPITLTVTSQQPDIHTDYTHLPVSVIYSQDELQLGSFNGTIAFMHINEVKEKTIFTSRFN